MSRKTRDSRSPDQDLQVQIDALRRRLGQVNVISGPYPGSTLAAPSVEITLSNQPGTAITGMRSDGAPALSQAIAPTMTAAWNWTPALGSTLSMKVNAISGQTANMQTWNPYNGLDTVVTKDGHVGIGDESPTAMVSIRGRVGTEPANYIKFTGANQILNFPNRSAEGTDWLYSSNTDITVEFLIKFDPGFPDYTPNGIIIGGHGGTVLSGGGREHWTWRVGYKGGKIVNINHIDTAPSAGSPYTGNATGASADLRDGLWHHVGIKIDVAPTRTISYYVDNVLIATGTTSPNATEDIPASYLGTPSPRNWIRFGHLDATYEYGASCSGMSLGGLLISDGLSFVQNPPSLVELIPAGTIASYPQVKRYWPMTDASGQNAVNVGGPSASSFPAYFGTSEVSVDAADPSWQTGSGSGGSPTPLTHWKNSTGAIDSIVNQSMDWGIGTATPTSKLHVVGRTSTTSLIATSLTGLMQGKGAAEVTAITDSSTVGQVLSVTGPSTYAWGALSLSTGAAITGILPVANGGTGLNTLATGSLVYGAGTSAFSTLGIGTAGQILQVNAGATAPQWSSVSGDVTMATGGAVTLASVITAGGPTGSATVVPVITYDAKGRLTSVTTATISGVPAAAHDILSATHGDALAGAVVRGDLIVGNSTPKWSRLAISATPGDVLTSDGTDVGWAAPAAGGSVSGSGTTNRMTYWSDGPGSVLGNTDFVFDPGISSGFGLTLYAGITMDQFVAFPDTSGTVFVDNSSNGLTYLASEPLLQWAPPTLTAGNGGMRIWGRQDSPAAYFEWVQAASGLVTCHATGGTTAGSWKFTGTGTNTVEVVGNLKSTRFNNLSITDNGSPMTLNIANNKTLTVSNTTTLNGGTHSGTNTGDNAVNTLYSGLVSNATHTGDVTGSTALTIANDAVTYAKMQNVSATDKLLGRSTAGSGDVEEIACTAAGRALLDDSTIAEQRATLGLSTVIVAAADFAVNSVADVTIVSQAVTGIVAGDQIMVEGFFTILNNSGAGRSYVMTFDWDSLFDIEITSHSVPASATNETPGHFKSLLSVRSTSLAYCVNETRINSSGATASGGDSTQSGGARGQGWGSTATDATGSTTFTFLVRSGSATATQTLRLHSCKITKLST